MSANPTAMVERARRLPAYAKCPPSMMRTLIGQAMKMKSMVYPPLVSSTTTNNATPLVSMPMKRPAAAGDDASHQPRMKMAKVGVDRAPPKINEDKGFVAWAQNTDECVYVADRTTK